MDNLEKIDRLFALKVRGALSEDEFLREKTAILTGNTATYETTPVCEAEHAPSPSPTRYHAEYTGDVRSKLAAGGAMFLVIAAAAWWFIGSEHVNRNDDSPLSTYIIGGWVHYDPKLSAEVRCSTDSGMIFRKGGEYAELEDSGVWTASGDQISVKLESETNTYRIVRTGPDRAQFFNLALDDPDGWDGHRCPML